MLSTTSKTQRYKSALQVLADFAEKPPTLTPTDSEQHTSARSSEKHHSARVSDQHRSVRTSAQHSSTRGSEQTSSRQSIETCSTTSSKTRSTTSSRSQKDSTRGHSRGLSKGKRNKALLFQRAAEVLAANGFGTTTPDPTTGKEKHSSASQAGIHRRVISLRAT